MSTISLSLDEKRALAKDFKIRTEAKEKTPPKTKKEEPSVASTLASSFGVGFVKFAKGTQNLKEGVQLGTYELINEVGGFFKGEGFEMSANEKKRH